VFPEWETRLYHCSLPHYSSQGTFLKSVVLVINVHYAPDVCCVTTSVHCVGVHHVVINVHHVMLVFIMLLQVLVLLVLIVIINFLRYNRCCSSCYCWCSSCCFPPFYGWYYPYPYIILQIKVFLEVDGCWLLVALAKLLQFKYVQVFKKLCDFFSIFFLY
jgi:hypothetical protein